MKTHSEFPASSAGRLIACPGSLRLTRELKDAGVPPRRSIYAAQGTVAHAIAEELLAHRGDPVKQAELRGTYMLDEIGADGHQIIVDQDFLDHVQTYVTYIETLEAFDYDLKFEQRVSPTYPWLTYGEKPPIDLFGTADCSGVQRQRGDIAVIDLKFGSGVNVAVEDNPQLLYYALGVVSSLANTTRIKAGTPVELVVIQPRVLGGHEPKIFNTTVGAIIDWGNDVFRPAVEAALDPLARLNAGDHCKWCPAISVCPELERLAVAKVHEFFDDGQLKMVFPEELGPNLLIADTLEMWIEALREEAIRRLERGEAVTGHKLVAKRAIRKWIDENAAAGIAAASGFDITQRVVLSPAQAEKTGFDVSPYVNKQSSGHTLAREGDPRPAVEPPKSTLLEDLKGSLNG